MSGVDAAGALARAATLGPYFRWEPAESGAGWRPWRELADEEVVAERVRTARTALAQRGGLSEDVLPERVVASVTFLGYAARAVSPLLAAAAMTGTFPIVAPADLWWRPVSGGPLPLAYTGAVPRPTPALSPRRSWRSRSAPC
ncbi:hypothetical protein HC028_17125 [Planosporangium flavigriseum]|uniref:Uncharacterized protein n=1 Tax=Planosporangium flavigriseum TaxID=373681 RepID=A0A8J3LZT1_9ACTN|nr:hypothetical protein [Planosporangium flavigriseum]NJC66214.1 hypothetical protein [Planosporangium flavigriseum]GIG76405.1 hypothetical protein Pfl04_48090 [Planosporangium flavigriseum]